jgi:hypothetical protein
MMRDFVPMLLMDHMPRNPETKHAILMEEITAIAI